MLPALLAVLAAGLNASQASATCALGACIDARPTWSGGREGGNSPPERECPACDEADRRAAAAAEAYALSHIPEPSELPRADTVAEREQDTVAATEKNEASAHTAILAYALMGARVRNPYAAGLMVLFAGGYILINHPSLDLSRITLLPFAIPSSGGMSQGGSESSPGDPNHHGPRKPRKWKLGGHKSKAKWLNQMSERGWTEQQIEEALKAGERFDAPNKVNPGNPAGRYVHPETGRYIVIDEATNEILQIAGDGFHFEAP